MQEVRNKLNNVIQSVCVNRNDYGGDKNIVVIEVPNVCYEDNGSGKCNKLSVDLKISLDTDTKKIASVEATLFDRVGDERFEICSAMRAANKTICPFLRT